MKSSSITARICGSSPSPVVTPAQLALACELILEEVRNMLSTPPTQNADLTRPGVPRKVFSSISDLRKITGLSRERICRLIAKNKSTIRTLSSSPQANAPRYHTQDFLAVIASTTKPKP